MKIPYIPFGNTNKHLKAELLKAFERVVDSEWYIMGNELALFEKTFAQYCGSNHCIGVGNGFDALYLSLKALGIGIGDEVIVPAHTFVATAMAVVHTGASVVFADVNSNDYLLNAELIEPKISDKTRAIIPVHLYGLPVDMDPIMDLANGQDIFIIEDFAQAHGATYKGKKVGSIGNVNATSFYPIKNLGALGDAGAITTNNDDIAKRIFDLRNYGGADKYDKLEPGVNSRLDELQAALLSEKIKKLDQWNLERNAIAERYKKHLEGVGDLTFQQLSDDRTHVYHVFSVYTKHRDKLKKHLLEKGIETMIHYPVPVHQQKVFRDILNNSTPLPTTEALAKGLLSIPLYPGLSIENQEYIVDQIQSFYK